MANGDVIYDRKAFGSLVTTTTDAGQLIGSITLPLSFRGHYRATIEGLSTTAIDGKYWLSTVVVGCTGAGAASVGTPEDLMTAVVSGAGIGAPTLAMGASGQAIELTVTPGNTNSTRWSAFVELIGVIEDWT